MLQRVCVCVCVCVCVHVCVSSNIIESYVNTAFYTHHSHISGLEVHVSLPLPFTLLPLHHQSEQVSHVQPRALQRTIGTKPSLLTLAAGEGREEKGVGST